MKVTKGIVVLVTLLILPVIVVGTKFIADTNSRLANEEFDRILPELELKVSNMKEPYRFPLDTRSILQEFGSFNTGPRFPNLYHAAIDYLANVGSPVYAIADGTISYSGYMDGYPGLVIIDHPNEDLYSLYGHLSMTRWIAPTGAIRKGGIVGYIAHPSEDFGIGSFPHLHFTIRTGLRDQYSDTDSGRWMRGYSSEHPIFKGYIDPAMFITLTMSAADYVQ